MMSKGGVVCASSAIKVAMILLPPKDLPASAFNAMFAPSESLYLTYTLPTPPASSTLDASAALNAPGSDDPHLLLSLLAGRGTPRSSISPYRAHFSRTSSKISLYSISPRNSSAVTLVNLGQAQAPPTV